MTKDPRISEPESFLAGMIPPIDKTQWAKDLRDCLRIMSNDELVALYASVAPHDDTIRIYWDEEDAPWNVRLGWAIKAEADARDFAILVKWATGSSPDRKERR